MKTYPLNETQLGMFLEWSGDHASTQYVIDYEYVFPLSVDGMRLEKAIRAFVDANPVHRTRFLDQDGEVCQYVDPSIEIPYVHRKMSDEEYRQLVATFPRPFDLVSEPLCRFTFVTTPTAFHLLFEISHLIADFNSDIMAMQLVCRR